MAILHDYLAPLPLLTRNLVLPAFIASCPDTHLSFLLLARISPTMRRVSLPCFCFSQYFLLRLEPVIQSPFANASLIQLVGSLGDLFMEFFRQRYLTGCLGTVSGGLADLFRWLRSHGSHLEIHFKARFHFRLGGPWGTVKPMATSWQKLPPSRRRRCARAPNLFFCFRLPPVDRRRKKRQDCSPPTERGRAWNRDSPGQSHEAESVGYTTMPSRQVCAVRASSHSDTPPPLISRPAFNLNGGMR